MREYTHALLPVFLVAAVLTSGCVSQNASTGNVKEFNLETSFAFEDGTPQTHFSPNEITVNRGDTVRIVINVDAGVPPDFNRTDFNSTRFNAIGFNSTGFNRTMPQEFNRTMQQGFNRTGGRRGGLDFNIDEFGVHITVQPGQPVTAEFVADRSGEFTYYISTGGRESSSGILKVLDV